jgi:hypothetical protein
MGSIATVVSSGSSVASWAGWSSPTSSGSCDDDKLDLGGVIGAVLVTMLVLVVLGAVRGRGKTAPRT